MRARARACSVLVPPRISSMNPARKSFSRERTWKEVKEVCKKILERGQGDFRSGGSVVLDGGFRRKMNKKRFSSEIFRDCNKRSTKRKD